MTYSLAEWATGSTAHLLRVPWDPSYKDVISWTPDDRDQYFHKHVTKSWTLTEMQYLKPGEPVAVPLMYDDCWQANYLVVENSDCPTASHTPPVLCYFVTNVAYVNPNTSTLELQLDVWNTFALDAKFGTCYVERGHIVHRAYCGYYFDDTGMWPQFEVTDENDPDKLDGVGRWHAANRFLMEPEGLDVGSEYRVGYHTHVDLTTWVNREGQGGEIGVLVVSSVSLAADWGSESSPNVAVPRAYEISGTLTNLDCWYMAVDDYTSLTADLQDYPWISKGISNVYIIPRSFVDVYESASSLGPNKRPAHQVRGGATGFSNGSNDPLFRKDWRALVRSCYPNWGDNAWYEKLCYWPYAYLVIDTNEGNPLVLKPELLSNGEVNIRLIGTVAPPTVKVGVYPVGYGNDPVAPSNGVNVYSALDVRNQEMHFQAFSGYGLQNAAWIKNINQTQVVNDEYNYYLASTYHTREASYAGASWSLARSNASAGLAYNQTLTNLANEQQNQNLRNQQVQNSILAGLGSGAIGAIGSVVGGNVFGAVSGAANTLINAGTTYANNQLSNQQFANNQQTALTLAGQNKGLANWAAQGDYAQTIRQLNATVQDAAVTQPSVGGMAAGDAFNLDHALVGFDVYVMVPSWGRALALADYFNRYGYTCNRLVDMSLVDNLCVMTHFAYWKLQDCVITDWKGDDSTRDVVRGIMERGVTVYRAPEDIGHTGINGYHNVCAARTAYYY